MHDELRRRLESFRIDPPDTAFPFARRLAHENGWSAAFAQRVVVEYFRFVWLAMRAGHPVTPSPAVDEAWHLHLCYTRSYWDELCGKVLGKPLHHGPTRGGAAEAAKYADWYARTLASYREHFGEPPADIWPPASERFRGGIPRKVDVRAHWIVPKVPVQRALVAVGLAVVLSTVGACQASGGGTLLLVFGALGLVGVFAYVMSAARGGRGQRTRGCSGGGCATGGVTGCGGSGHGHGHGDGHGHAHGDGHGGDSGGDGGGSSGGGDGGGGGCGGGGGGCGGGGD